MKLAWMTDIHLNFLDDYNIEMFLKSINQNDFDYLTISGDISDAIRLIKHLEFIEKWIKKPVYFVLGNHDFYHGSFEDIDEKVRKFCKDKNLIYLTNNGIFKLSKNTGLIGHNGWADGGYGDYLNSRIDLNDYYKIHDLIGLNKMERLTIMNKMGKTSSRYLSKMIENGFEQFNNLILVTHVSPFKEACYYKNQISGEDYLPYYSCKSVGDMIKREMKKRPDKKIMILCGHTHFAFEKEFGNISIKVGQSEYRYPKTQEIINIT